MRCLQPRRKSITSLKGSFGRLALAASDCLRLIHLAQVSTADATKKDGAWQAALLTSVAEKSEKDFRHSAYSIESHSNTVLRVGYRELARKVFSSCEVKFVDKGKCARYIAADSKGQLALPAKGFSAASLCGGAWADYRVLECVFRSCTGSAPSPNYWRKAHHSLTEHDALPSRSVIQLMRCGLTMRNHARRNSHGKFFSLNRNRSRLEFQPSFEHLKAFAASR